MTYVLVGYMVLVSQVSIETDSNKLSMFDWLVHLERVKNNFFFTNGYLRLKS